MQAVINKHLNIKQYINLHDKQMLDAGAEYLFEKDIQAAKMVWLSDNKITAKGLLSFSKIQWKSLVFLSLKNNRIGDKGCKYIKRAHCQHLQTLDLTNNEIGSGGTLHLSKKKLPKLKRLYLVSNFLGDSACKWLTKAKWPEIKAIGLNENKMGFIQIINIVLIDSRFWQDVSHDENLTEPEESMKIFKIMSEKMDTANLMIQNLHD